jgi:hypothetical protein
MFAHKRHPAKSFEAIRLKWQFKAYFGTVVEVTVGSESIPK